MLILGRNPGQAILIGDNIVITIVSSKNGQVRVGIEAPREIPVLRKELKLLTKKRAKNGDYLPNNVLI